MPLAVPAVDLPDLRAFGFDLTPSGTIPAVEAGLAWWPVLAIVVLMMMINVAAHKTTQNLYMFWALGGSIVVLALGVMDGNTWTDLGLGIRTWAAGLVWGAALMLLVFLVMLAGSSLHLTRNAFADENIATMSKLRVYWNSLVELPFGTVLFEEVAFRAVLWASLTRRLDWPLATAITALLFGLWHILPSLDLHERNPSLARGGSARVQRATAIGGSILTTAIGGALFSCLRMGSGSLFAPMAFHWATNGWGYLFARRVAARQDGPS